MKDQKDQKLNLRWNVINYTWLVKESQEKEIFVQIRKISEILRILVGSNNNAIWLPWNML